MYVYVFLFSVHILIFSEAVPLPQEYTVMPKKRGAGSRRQPPLEHDDEAPTEVCCQLVIALLY